LRFLSRFSIVVVLDNTKFMWNLKKFIIVTKAAKLRPAARMIRREENAVNLFSGLIYELFPPLFYYINIKIIIMQK